MTLLACALGACGEREGLPSLHASARESYELDSAGGERPTSPAEPRAVSRSEDPVRKSLSKLYAKCERVRRRLEGEISRAQRRQGGAAVAAVAAWIVGEAVDSDSDAPTDGLGGAPRYPPLSTDPTPRDVDETRAGIQRLPSKELGAASPLRQRTDETRFSAHRRVRRINQAIDDLDAFLFSNAHSASWTPQQREEWNRLRARLGERCTG